MDPQGLSDRLAIREVIDRYSDAVTRRAWPEVGAAFHAGAIWRAGAPFNLEFHTPEGIQAGLCAGVGGFDFLVQMTHSVVIDLQGERASARTVIQEVARNAAQRTGLCLLGVYNDTLSRQGGRWGFEQRRFEPLYLDTTWIDGMAFLAGT
jgi:hypothetical protein